MDIIEIEEAFKSFDDILDNWDGYGGRKPIKSILENSNNFINLLSIENKNKISDIYLNPNGTISILFEVNPNRRISLEIGLNESSYYFKLDENNVEYNDNYNIFDTKLIRELNIL